ncbi:pilus assembly protein [Dyella monticola]|nr:PilC/PilY family type IV pilus protein [Dyella monticola]
MLTNGSLAFEGGYDPADWSGALKAFALRADGSTAGIVWDAGALLTDSVITPPAGRTILTAHRDATGAVSGIAFEPRADFDSSEMCGLRWPTSENNADLVSARVDYLRGVRSHELDGSMHARGSLLGAIVHAQAVYVGAPTAHYSNVWPSHGNAVTAPEMAVDAQRYSQFAQAQVSRSPMVYMAANDGMLHALRAPVPICTAQDPNGQCTAYDGGVAAGKEGWAFVPRAVYGYLGALTRAHDFLFQPTVDSTPVTRDVFFGERGWHEWHTLLVGGLGLGGRGVYALDITHPDEASEAFPERTVLWELDADAPVGISQAGTAYNPADIGYTFGQSAIARLANGRWAVLMPSGYFADCSKPDKPLHCKQIGGTSPDGYSALFVLDAQTGAVISELKTPTSIDGVTSYGLSTPVLGDYDNDQIDDVAFAGDLAGNLWRFDLSAPDPAHWNVTLMYRPTDQGTQPITTMPRLFPDPATGRFMVVFGTGRYLGEGDKTTTVMQSIYGIRDEFNSADGSAIATRDSLQQQTLSEATVSDASGAVTTVRDVSAHDVPATAGGWRIDLDIHAGERVVVTPGALFNTNTVLVTTLIPDGDESEGAFMALDATTGGAKSLLTFGGASHAGARVEHPPLSTGTLPMMMRVGGGSVMLPSLRLKGGTGDLRIPISLDGSLWRRRSWSLLTDGT